MRSIRLAFAFVLVAAFAHAATTGFRFPLTAVPCPCVTRDAAPDMRQDPVFLGVYEFDEITMAQTSPGQPYNPAGGRFLTDSSSEAEPLDAGTAGVMTTRSAFVQQQCGAMQQGSSLWVATCNSPRCVDSERCPVLSPFTAACRVRPDNFAARRFWATGDSSSGSIGSGYSAGWRQTVLGTGTFNFGIDPTGPSNEFTIDTATTYSPSQWHHHAVRYFYRPGDPAGTLSQFVDGTQDATTTTSAPVEACDANWHLGGGAFNRTLTGYYDECWISDNALSDATVCKLAVCGVDGCGCSCDWGGNPAVYTAAARHVSFGGSYTCTLPACDTATASTIVPSTTTTSTSSTTSTTVFMSALYVDGACPTSGTGASINCGPTGPFKTIGEGVVPMASGDTLNIRGVHADHPGCDADNPASWTSGEVGVYFEGLYLNASPPSGYGGDQLPCLVGSRCTIQGCRAAQCGADEEPRVRGMRLRADWVDEGGGIWSRAMEATPVQDTTFERGTSGTDAADAGLDPMILVESGLPLAYAGDNVASPADGKWSFQTASDTIRVNPTGAGIPATTIHVPHYSFIIIGETPTAYVTFAHMALEGTRSVIADLGDPNQGIVGLEMNNVDIRHWRTYAYQLHSDTDVNIHDSTLEYGARGVSFGLTGSFAFRTFAMHNGTYANNIIRHIGAGGVTKAGGGAGWECSWCDAPWDSLTHTQFSVLGAAIQVKQTTTFLVDGNTISDISGVAIGNDVSRFMTVSDNTVTAARSCLSQNDFTPTGGCPTPGTTNWCYAADSVYERNQCNETGLDDSGSCAVDISGNDSTTRHTGSVFLAKVRNNFVRNPGYCGIMVRRNTAALNDTPPGDVDVMNNTIFGDNLAIEADQLSRGIVIEDGTANIVVKNNLFVDLTDECLVVDLDAMDAVTIDYDLYDTCPIDVRWDAVVPTSGQPSGGTTGTRAAYNAAVPPSEASGVNGDAALVSSTDLHLQPTSDAIDVGQSQAAQFTNDIDGNNRGVWDIGADEWL